MSGHPRLGQQPAQPKNKTQMKPWENVETPKNHQASQLPRGGKVTVSKAGAGGVHGEAVIFLDLPASQIYRHLSMSGTAV